MSIILLAVYFNFTIGCSSTNLAERNFDEKNASNRVVIEELSTNKIAKLRQNDGRVVQFDERGAKYVESFIGQDSVIVGSTTEGQLSVIKLRGIQEVWYQGLQINVLKVAAYTIGIAAVSFVVLVLTEYIYLKY